MPQEPDSLNEEEKLKAENDFLKMKLMLERGAYMGGENEELPADIENQFLNNVMAFEKQFEERKTIKLFDKIKRPQHFKPVADISDKEIEEAYNSLLEYLNEHSIDFSVCSPNIPVRELYRFITEELFEHDMDDLDLPGWTTNFIYDEFHPDPVYDNSRLVRQNLLYDIFRKKELFHDLDYAKEGFVFNNRQYDEFSAYKERISRFKSLFDEIELLESDVSHCQVGETVCEVKGSYKAIAKVGKDEMIYEGDFKVDLVLSDLGYWDMKRIVINGFNLE